jgi:hypothetical protein
MSFPDPPSRVDSPQIQKPRSLKVQTSLQKKHPCDQKLSIGIGFQHYDN